VLEVTEVYRRDWELEAELGVWHSDPAHPGWPVCWARRGLHRAHKCLQVIEEAKARR
jgi:ATP sulfurylase